MAPSMEDWMKHLSHPTRLKDAMYNFSPKSGASDEYCKGMLVGAVAALISTGMTWRDALAHCAICMPDDARMQKDTSVPASWEGALHVEFMASRWKTRI